VIAQTKLAEDGDQIERWFSEHDLTPLEAHTMLTTTDSDALSWYPDIKQFEIIEVYSPDDKLVRWTLDMSWALKKLFSIPE